MKMLSIYLLAFCSWSRGCEEAFANEAKIIFFFFGEPDWLRTMERYSKSYTCTIVFFFCDTMARLDK